MKSIQQIHSTLRPYLKDIEDFRKEMQREQQLSKWIVIAFIGIMIVCTIPFKLYWLTMWGVVVGVLAFAFTPNSKEDYKQTVKYRLKNTAVPALLSFMDTDISYKPSSYVPVKDFVNSYLYTRYINRYSGEDWFGGQIGETSFMFSKILAERKLEIGEPDEEYYTTVFDGIFMVADFHKHFEGRTFVHSNRFGLSNKKRLVMEDTEFEKHFKVYSTDEVEARYLLSPNMQQRIVTLKKKLNRNINISFVDSCVCIAIPNAEIFDFNLDENLLESRFLEKFYEELRLFLDIIEDLNLNTRIWSKQTF